MSAKIEPEEGAPGEAGLRWAVGKALSSALDNISDDGVVRIDPFDSDNIDRLVDAVIEVLAAQPVSARHAAMAEALGVQPIPQSPRDEWPDDAASAVGHLGGCLMGQIDGDELAHCTRLIVDALRKLCPDEDQCAAAGGCLHNCMAPAAAQPVAVPVGYALVSVERLKDWIQQANDCGTWSKAARSKSVATLKGEIREALAASPATPVQAREPLTDSQHARDSAELRRLCAERDQLRAEVTKLRKLDSKRALFQAGRDSYQTHAQPMNTDDEAWDEYLRAHGITKQGGA